ncbi:transient receptor potential cation channel subfamily M member 6-like [Dendronephthya gigantea]|uniref:transient receptor potential cation channel subfamily M member 6-like n=1 Tax=Dendronephthya gigantea TaxID=151771 RepID=UPI00106A5970|nr:transient receptor potential cation channel subfamily M member 6-like [Dendronephthya gigantea]
MLKLGRVIKPKKEVITLQIEEFLLKDKMWQDPVEVKLSVETEKFACGGFRDAFIAEAISGISPRKYVLKRYKGETVNSIIELFESTEIHTRKSVQMNALAQNFAKALVQEKPEDFGDSFNYIKVYFAKHNDDCVTLEPYLDGPFRKFVNNNGDIIPLDDEEASLKAQCFCHYTYVKSGKQLMVLDIQGVGYNLCDPEIASTNLKDVDNERILFCSGNLSLQAIETFLIFHSCNKYCKLLDIVEQE